MNRRTECEGMQKRTIGLLKHRLQELSLTRDGGKFATTKTNGTKTKTTKITIR